MKKTRQKLINEHPGGALLIPGGFVIQMENNSLAAVLLPRSGAGHKHGIVPGNSESFTINPGNRIMQMVFVPGAQTRIDAVNEFTVADRGVGGFGHSCI